MVFSQKRYNFIGKALISDCFYRDYAFPIILAIIHLRVLRKAGI
jgi:hypothetical protein